jgi:Family of unknown function (DUF5670)
MRCMCLRAEGGCGLGGIMRYALLALSLLFVLVWFGAFVMFHIAGTVVHLLLVAALILFIIHLVASQNSLSS